MVYSTNESKSNLRIFIWVLSVLYLGIYIMPAMSRYAKGSGLGITVVFLYFTIILNNKESLNLYASFAMHFVFYSALIILNILFNSGNGVVIEAYRLVLNFLPVFLAFKLLLLNDRKIIKSIVIIAIIMFIFTSITSYFYLLTDSMAARIIATIGNSSDEYLILLNKKNVGGFAFVYSIVLLFPMIICIYRQKVINKFLFTIITIIFSLYILEAQYTIATILFSLSLILLFVQKNFSLKKAFVTVLFIIIICVVFKNSISAFFYYLSRVSGSFVLGNKFNFIGDILIGKKNNGDSGLRFELYYTSLSNFIRHPIEGSWLHKESVGGHSLFLDYIANFGIIGMGAIYSMYNFLYKKFYLPFKNETYYGFMVWTFWLNVVYSFVNPNMFFVSTFLIAPLIGYLFQNGEYTLVKNKSLIIKEGEISN